MEGRRSSMFHVKQRRTIPQPLPVLFHVKQNGRSGELEKRPLSGHPHASGIGLGAQTGLKETAHSGHRKTLIHQPKRSETVGRPAIGLFRWLTHNEDAPDAQQGSSTFRDCCWGAKGPGGHRVSLTPPEGGSACVLRSGKFCDDSSLPLHGHNRLRQQRHPALERIKQHDPEVGPGLGDH